MQLVAPRIAVLMRVDRDGEVDVLLNRGCGERFEERERLLADGMVERDEALVPANGGSAVPSLMSEGRTEGSREASFAHRRPSGGEKRRGLCRRRRVREPKAGGPDGREGACARRRLGRGALRPEPGAGRRGWG